MHCSVDDGHDNDARGGVIGRIVKFFLKPI